MPGDINTKAGELWLPGFRSRSETGYAVTSLQGTETRKPESELDSVNSSYTANVFRTPAAYTFHGTTFRSRGSHVPRAPTR